MRTCPSDSLDQEVKERNEANFEQLQMFIAKKLGIMNESEAR